MTLILNTEDDPIVEAIEEILEICEDHQQYTLQEAIDAIRAIALKAVVLDERERYIFPEGHC